MPSRYLTVVLAAIFLSVTVISCSGSGSPVNPPSNPASATASPSVGGSISNRQILFVGDVIIDADRSTVEWIPQKSANLHCNILSLLRNVCGSCIWFGNITVIDSGDFKIDFKIRHPFPDIPKFTAFDMRLVFVTPETYTFPLSGRKIAWDGSVPRMSNPDGYTSLFNPVEFPESGPLGPIMKYYHVTGHNPADLTANLNQFIAFARYEDRCAFLPGYEETRVIHMKAPPGSIKFGYAIDCCWLPGQTVVNPIADFPEEANCNEAYRIVPEIETWPSLGESGDISVIVSDHQFGSLISTVTIEAPDIFTGEIPLSFSTYKGDENYLFCGSFVNETGALEGDYPILITAMDTSSDPTFGTVNAYQVYDSDYDPVFNPHDVTPWPFGCTSAYLCADGNYLYSYSLTHTFDVLDFTDPLNPVLVKSICLPYTPYSYPASMMGIMMSFRASIIVNGGYAYVCNGDNGIINIIDVDPPGSAHAVYDISRPGVYSTCLAIENDILYVGNYEDGIDVYNISNPETPGFITTIAWVPGRAPAMRIAAQGDYIYVQGTTHTDIYNVNPPSAATYVHSIQYIEGGGLDVDGNYLYSTSGNGLYIVDITVPETAYVLNTVVASNAGDVKVLNGYAYCAIPGAGIQVFDVDPPGSAYLTDDLLITSTLAFNCAAVSGTLAYLPLAPQIHAVDVSDTSNLQLLASLGYQVWVGGIKSSNGYIFSSAGTTFNVFDVDPAESASLLTQVPFSVWSLADLEIKNNYVYLGEIYTNEGPAGINVIDITNPAAPSVVHNFSSSTMWALQKMRIRGDFLYIADNFKGLHIVDISNPVSAHLVTSVDVPYSCTSVDASGGYALVAIADNGLAIFDVNPASSAYFIGTVPIPGRVVDVLISGSYAYVASNYTFKGIHILDISNITSPSIVRTIPVQGNPLELQILGNYLFVLYPEEGMIIIDIHQPESADIINDFSIKDYAADIACTPDYAYISGELSGVRIIQLQ